jgi:hypothetical protein
MAVRFHSDTVNTSRQRAVLEVPAGGVRQAALLPSLFRLVQPVRQ